MWIECYKPLEGKFLGWLKVKARTPFGVDIVLAIKSSITMPKEWHLRIPPNYEAVEFKQMLRADKRGSKLVVVTRATRKKLKRLESFQLAP